MKINFSNEAKFYFEISLKKNFFFNEPSDILETKFWILNFEFSFQSSTQSSPLPPFFFFTQRFANFVRIPRDRKCTQHIS